MIQLKKIEEKPSNNKIKEYFIDENGNICGYIATHNLLYGSIEYALFDSEKRGIKKIYYLYNKEPKKSRKFKIKNFVTQDFKYLNKNIIIIEKTHFYTKELATHRLFHNNKIFGISILYNELK